MAILHWLFDPFKIEIDWFMVICYIASFVSLLYTAFRCGQIVEGRYWNKKFGQLMEDVVKRIGYQKRKGNITIHDSRWKI